MNPRRRKILRRFRFRDLKRCVIPGFIGFLGFLIYASLVVGHILHKRSSFERDSFGKILIDKNLNWREHEALQSIRPLFSNEAGKKIPRSATATTSILDRLSLGSFRNKNPSEKNSAENYGSPEGNEDEMVPGFDHGIPVFKDTPEMLYERNLRQDRRVKRANNLINDKSVHKFEKAAIARSRSVDSAPLGNYTIWNNDYRRHKTFEDMLRLMQDQTIIVRVYSGIAKMTKNLALHELLERQLMKLASEEEPTDIDHQQRLVDTIRETGKILAKANKQLYGCKLVTNKLRAMLQTAEDELEYTQTNIAFLTQLATKVLPNAIHCLTMRLNLEYYLLPLPMRNFPRRENLENSNLYHYALFSDNVLAASVVVNSTVMNAHDSARHVFHLVTDKLNFGAMSMWFLLNPPGDATIQVQRFEDFSWLNSSYSPVLRQLESEAMKKFYFKTEKSESAASDSENLKYRYPKYLSMLNHLRFYIPKIFPKLEKILFVDDDVVVQKDLAPLWSLDLKGKVNGAVQTCGANFHRLDTYLNFSDKHISENFNPKYCAWAYGMNIFDLKEWKKNNITETYHFWQDLNENRTLWKLGTLPPGLITFYNLTQPLQKKWHLLGLGYDKGIDVKKIETSVVIHFNGHMKPWTELAITKYQPYWTRYINFDHPYISSCRLFE